MTRKGKLEGCKYEVRVSQVRFVVLVLVEHMLSEGGN